MDASFNSLQRDNFKTKKSGEVTLSGLYQFLYLILYERTKLRSVLSKVEFKNEKNIFFLETSKCCKTQHPNYPGQYDTYNDVHCHNYKETYNEVTRRFLIRHIRHWLKTNIQNV